MLEIPLWQTAEEAGLGKRQLFVLLATFNLAQEDLVPYVLPGGTDGECFWAHSGITKHCHNLATGHQQSPEQVSTGALQDNVRTMCVCPALQLSLKFICIKNAMGW